MTPRAAPLPRDDRRSAIVAALVPLLVERGGEVSTREIARAANIAEGTIFSVFADKRSLLLAAAEEAINPAHGQEDFDEAMAAAATLREKVVIAAGRVLDRMQLTMSVMTAVRPHLVAAFHEAQNGTQDGAQDGAQDEDREPVEGQAERPPTGPPAFVLKAQEDLHHRLTGLFEMHRDELSSEPAVAALALRSLIFGASRPELGMATVLDAEQIADLLLDGVRRRES